MKLFSFFKKKKIKDLKHEVSKVFFDELESWIENKEKEIENKEKEIFELVSGRIFEVVKELEERLKILKNVDVDSKKVEDRIKLLVKESLRNYIEHVENFINALKSLEYQKTENFVDKINKIFTDFEKRSYMSYEKTTIIIGKEIATLKDEIVNLSKYLKKEFEKNKEILNSSKVVFLIKTKIKEIQKNNKFFEEVSEKIKQLNKEVQDYAEKNKKFTEEIEKIKKKPEYFKNLKKQEEVKLQKEKLKTEIEILKSLIDFKKLSNFFHKYEKDMKVVKEHKENFKLEFQKDCGEKILSLLDESKLNNSSILNKVKEVKGVKEKIKEEENKIKKNETEDLLAMVEKNGLEIEKLNDEKYRINKKHKKLRDSKEEFKNSLKKELEKFGVELEEGKV